LALALARKYRPRSFADLIGQESVSRTLSQALDSARLSHAYLFSGLRGSGKTSTARIFAKALLCDKGPTSTPCEECANCIMANEYRHMDIIEMDAASNRGIDDIKELIEHTKYKPSTGRFKIFIIDEVHMLTPQAFNALLKTLEEPPEFVKFILATTDPLKLPATILSRTQHFRFKKIPQKLIVAHLEHILTLEAIEYELDAIKIIARAGAGSLRDSLTLLDQAIVYANEKIDSATVTNMLGIIEPSRLDELLDFILKRDREKILEFIKSSREFESEMIIDELMLHLKELLFNQDSRFSPLIIERFFRVLADAKELLSLGSDGEFILSLTLFKMLEALSIKEIDEVINHLQKELKGVSKSPITTSAPPTKEPIKELEPIKQETQIDSGETKFKALIQKLYDRDYELGEIFEKNIRYKSFKDNSLMWESIAQGEDKKSLIRYWGIIRTYVQEIFGFDTKIVNINKEPTKQEGNLKDESIKPKENTPSNEATCSTIEAGEFPSSCMNPDTSNSGASREVDASKILEEPMIKEAITLFSPKRVRVKQKI